MANAFNDSLWDALGEEDRTGTPVRPLWTVQFEKDEELLKWFRNAVESLKKGQFDRVEMWRFHLEMYKGNHFPRVAPIPRDQDRALLRTQKERHLTVNQVYELTEQWVSRMTRFKPTVAVLPTNDEHTDRQNAKLAKLVWDHLSYISGMDMLIEHLARHSRVFGETYLYITWDPNRGDLHPDFMDAKRDGKRVKIAGVEGVDDQPLFFDGNIRIGEVCYKVLLPWQVYMEPRRSFSEVDWMVVEHDIDVDELRAQYPEKKIEISEHEEGEDLDAVHAGRRKENKTKVYEIWHRGTDLLDSGRYIKLTRNVVLENTPHPYSHRKLPVARLTDIDIPGELHGMSFYHNIAPLNHIYNKATTMIYRALALAAHPKWVMPKGATNVVNLGNMATVVEYTGGVPPNLQTYAPASPQLFSFREELRQEIERLAGVHSISRGQPPPGIRAGIALQFLEEQENQRSHTAIIKHNALIREIAIQSISLAGDYYDESDGRLVRILGKDNQFTIKALDNAQLSGPFDIRIQNTSALPESKAGKIQTILDLRETFGPEFIPDEQVADMIDIGQPEKYVNWVTVALRKAEAENEDILDGRTPGEPKEWEEHISHWQTHMKAIQSRSFELVSKGQKEKLFEHILTHEYLMWEKTQSATPNQAFLEKLQLLDGFPAFFKVPQPQPIQQSAPGIPGGGIAPQGIAPDETGAAPLPVGEPIPQGIPIQQEPALQAEVPPELPIAER